MQRFLQLVCSLTCLALMLGLASAQDGDKKPKGEDKKALRERVLERLAAEEVLEGEFFNTLRQPAIAVLGKTPGLTFEERAAWAYVVERKKAGNGALLQATIKLNAAVVDALAANPKSVESFLGSAKARLAKWSEDDEKERMKTEAAMNKATSAAMAKQIARIASLDEMKKLTEAKNRLKAALDKAIGNDQAFVEALAKAEARADGMVDAELRKSRELRNGLIKKATEQ